MTPKQRELDFTSTHARDTDTSRDAAGLIESQVNALQRKVLDYLRQCGARGATVYEIAFALGMLTDTVRPRISGKNELRDLGLVVDSGERRKPRPDARTRATVWLAKP